MYSKFYIDNFRGFSDFTIDSLNKINLISGKNNVGKTAFLEALWFHHGSPNPDLGIRLNRFRGITEINPSYPCLELFRNLDLSSKIKFSSISEGGVERSDKIYLREPSKIALQESKYPVEERQGSLPLDTITKEIVIDYIDEKGGKGQAIAHFTANEVHFDKRNAPIRSSARFLLSKRTLGLEDIEGFGQLEIKGKNEEILELLRLLEPRLKSVTVVVRGGTPSIWGDIGIGTLLPLQVMGDGLCRWLIFILAVLRSENGLVLVDEIENGIHYSMMVDIWKNLALLARRYNVQIFATTHSEECVKYAHKSFMNGKKYDFNLHRLEMINGRVNVVSYNKETLDIAIESGLEFR